MHMNSLYGRGYENGCSTWVLLPVFLIHTNNEYMIISELALQTTQVYISLPIISWIIECDE